MGLDDKFCLLDNVDLSMYLVYTNAEMIMREIEKDYSGIFDNITECEFIKYIHIRYML